MTATTHTLSKVIPNDSGANVTVDVALDIRKIDEAIDLGLKNITLPLTTSQQKSNSVQPKSLLIPLKNIKYSITVECQLKSDTTSTAIQKKQALISRSQMTSATNPEIPASTTTTGIIWRNGALTLTHRSETFVGDIVSINFTDVATRTELTGANRGTSPDRIDVTFTFIIYGAGQYKG